MGAGFALRLGLENPIMHADRLQKQRFEIKYLVTEPLALAARDFVRSYLVSDEFCADQPNFSYAIHSVYLDSDELKFYRQTLDGEKNRIKMRVRFYDAKPESPLFLEIKRRTNNVISKQRCPITREAVPAILAGQTPESHSILLNESGHLHSLQSFLNLQTSYGAKPKAHVRYLREAWVSPADNSVRVTMDRDVRFNAQFDGRLSTDMASFISVIGSKVDMASFISVFGAKVVLEIKFTNRFPDWFKEFVRLFNLRQCSAAKYAEGVAVFGDQRLIEGARSFAGNGNAGLPVPMDALKEVA